MRLPSGISALGLVALLVAAGMSARPVAGAAPSTASTAATLQATSSYVGVECVGTGAGGFRAFPHPPGTGAVRHRHRHAGLGNLAVAVPPMVFIRRHGEQLFVSTNTGEPPGAGDIFYYVGHGGYGVSKSLRDRILRDCSATGHR